MVKKRTGLTILLFKNNKIVLSVCGYIFQQSSVSSYFNLDIENENDNRVVQSPRTRLGHYV